MNKRRSVVSLFALALLFGTVGLSLTAPGSQKAPQQQARLKTPKTPEQVIYSAFFHYVVNLQQQAAELESDGGKGDGLRAYVQIQAGLDYEEARHLDEIASECVEAVAKQDAKAQVVIERFRSQFPGGRIPSGVKPPSPPPELKALQQERDAIILEARDHLRTALREQGFYKITEFIAQRIAPNTQPVPLEKR